MSHAALSQEPSLLEHHLPSIRDTILQLLQGLKRKQALLHEKSPTTRSPAMNQNQKSDMVNSTSTSSELDMMDPNTQHAVTQLRDDGDLAARSSIRRSSTMEPVNGTNPSLSIAATIDSSSTAIVIQPPARRRRGLLASPSQPDLSKPGTPSPPPRRISTTTPSSPTEMAPCRKKSTVVVPVTTHTAVMDNTEMPLVLFLQWKNRTKRVVVEEPLNSLHQVMDLFRCTFKNAFNNTSDSDTMKISLWTMTQTLYDLVTNDMELMEMIQQALKTQFDQWTSLISISPNNGPGAAITTVDTSLNNGLDSSMHIGDEASHGAISDNTVPTLTQQQQQQQQQSLVNQVRNNFSILQKAIKEHEQNTEKLMTQLADYQQQQQQQQQEQKQQQQQEQQEQQEQQQQQNLEQKELSNHHLQKSLQDMGHALTTRLETLQDTIDDMKQDVTQRRCRPSPSQLDDCHKESDAVKDMIRSLGEYISQSKPSWKKSWEEQLQRIVSEQQCVKEYEHLVLDFEEDHSAILTVLQHLTQVSELQKRQPVGSNPVMVDISGGDNDDDDDQGHGGGGREGMGYVLQQLQTIDVDHQKRLDALAQAEKRRARDMANRIDDFEKELITFVDTNKLKKTGGPEHLERQQQEKTKQLLMDLYEKNKAT
ncbi:unnamed protein product [Absidia cylindrospora]